MIPMASMLANSFLANMSLSRGRQQACACTGGPLVEMKCSTPCFVAGLVNLGTVISQKSVNSMSY